MPSQLFATLTSRVSMRTLRSTLAKRRSPAASVATGAADARTGERAIPVKIGYLCSKYPGGSHTFVLRGVNAVRGAGADIETFSIRRARPEELLAHADRVAFQSTFAILPSRWTTLLAAHLKLLTVSPVAYL